MVQRLADSARAMETGALQLARSVSGAQVGVSGTIRITASQPAHHSVRRSTDQEVKSLAPSILTQMPDGVLLQKKLSALALIYRHSGPQASADSFLLQVL